MMASLEPDRKKIKLEHEKDSNSFSSMPSTSQLDLFNDWTDVYSDKLDPQTEDEVDIGEQDYMDELDFEGIDFQNQPKAENEKDTFMPLSRAQLVELMNAKLAEVREMHEDTAILRALMTHYKWQKESLLEKFLSGKEECFQELGIGLQDSNEDEEVCCICLDSESAITRLACSHAVCENCLHEYIVSEIKKRESCIRCPQCKIPVSETKVIEILGANSNEFQHNLIEGFVNTNPNIKWCKTPDTICGRAIVVKNPEKVQTVICNCCNCFCFKCENVAHEPLPCNLLTKWIEKSVYDANTAWVLKNAKPCPNCKSPIEKNGGCNQMTCGKCGQHFCWICLQSTTYHHSFCIRPKKIFSQESEEMRLERSLFYRGRFNDHEQSFNLEKKLGPRLEQYLKRVPDYDKKQYDFLKEALQTLTLSRNTLKWTFAFASFIKPSSQLYIFEDNQIYLQKATEALSGLMESEFKTAFKDNIKGGNDFKRNVLDAIEYCKQRRTAMLHHAKDGTMDFEGSSYTAQTNTSGNSITARFPCNIV